MTVTQAITVLLQILADRGDIPMTMEVPGQENPIPIADITLVTMEKALDEEETTWVKTHAALAITTESAKAFAARFAAASEDGTLVDKTDPEAVSLNEKFIAATRAMCEVVQMAGSMLNLAAEDDEEDE